MVSLFSKDPQYESYGMQLIAERSAGKVYYSVPNQMTVYVVCILIFNCSMFLVLTVTMSTVSLF